MAKTAMLRHYTIRFAMIPGVYSTSYKMLFKREILIHIKEIKAINVIHLTQHSMPFTQPSHHGNLRPFFLDLFPVPEACFLGSLDCDDNIDDMKSTFSMTAGLQ